MKAKVLMEFIIDNICEPEDINEGNTFEALVTDLINEEGIIGIADDGGVVVKVVEVK